MENVPKEMVEAILRISASNEYRGVEVQVLREALERVLAQGSSVTSLPEIKKWILETVRERMNAKLAQISDDEPQLASILKKLIEGG